MKNKLFLLTTTILFLVLPTILFGSEGGSQTYKFFKGDGDIENWFLDAFATMQPEAASEATSAAAIGRAIGAIGALGYLSYLGWEMAEGQRPWAVTPMIKPILISFILINWVKFTDLIKSPFEALAKPSVAMFNNLAEKSEDLRIKRYELQWTIVEKAIKIEAENKLKKDEENKQNADGIVEKMGVSMNEAWGDLKLKIYEWELKTASTLQTLVAEVIEAIALIILRVCVYGIFAFQKLWSMILMILGPIAVGISLLPGFDGALQSWISKFININLWTFISFKAMSIGSLLITSGYTMEINRYKSVLDGTDDEIIANVGTFVNGSGFINVIVITCVAYIVTGLLTLMTPTIADSIVSAGGSGVANAARGAASSMSGGAKSAGGGIQKTGMTVAKGATAGTQLAKQAGRSIAGAAQRVGNLTHQKGEVTPKW